MYSTHGVLVEYENVETNEIYTNSGLLFKDKFIIITCNVLMPYLKSFSDDLHKWLADIQPKRINFLPFASALKKPQLRIIYKKENQVKFKQADVIASFVCKNILNSCQRYLHDWAIDFDDKEYHTKQFLSLFFILKIVDNNTDGIIEDLNAALRELLEEANKWQVETGKEVFIESTPFGNRSFLNSYSQGVVSNIIGEDSCFLLTDCPSAPGSEGCPVFIKLKSNRHRYPIGIVISCLNWWKGEWIGLTLSANLVPLLSQFVSVGRELEINGFSKNEIILDRNLLYICTNSLIQIVSGAAWGAGMLLDKEKGLFLTNSHVIENDTNINLYWKDKQISAKLLYKTPNSDVYDIAILQCAINAISDLNISQVQISLKPAFIGEEVFAAGFPLFAKELKPKPTLTKGHVSQTSKSMIKTTCSVLPGSSGGAILRPNGELIAVIVSNIRMDALRVVYPRVNMTIPILAIYDVIREFLYTDDLNVLGKLHSEDMEIKKHWTQLIGKL